MALTVTIGGAAKKLQALSLSAAQNERDRLTATYISLAGDDIPDIDDEMLVTDGASLIFGGTIKERTVTGLAKPPAVETTLSALDFNELGDRLTVTKTIATGKSLKAVATLILPYLPGVTLSPTQATGPTLDELSYDGVYADAVLADLSERTGWLRTIDASKVLSFFQAGSVLAPWDVTDGDGNTIGNLSIAKSRIDYANRITVKYSTTARAAYAFLAISDNFHNGDTIVIAGRTYTWQTTLTNVDGNIHVGASAEESLDSFVAALTLGAGAGTAYAADMTVNGSVTAEISVVGTHAKVSALATGTAGNSITVTTTGPHASWVGDDSVPCATLLLGADSALTNSVTVNDGAEQALYGVYAKIVESPNTYTSASATSLGNALLATAIVVPETVTYTTKRAGIRPGMVQTIASAYRSFASQSCLVTSVSSQFSFVTQSLWHTVTAITGTVFKKNKWRDQYKKWAGTSSGSAVVGTVSGGGSTGSASRVYTLGGSRSTLVAPVVAAYTPIADWMPVYGAAAFSGRVRAWLWAHTAGVTVTLRVVSSTDGVTWPGTLVTTLSSVTSTTATERTALVSVELGKYYRVEILSSLGNEGGGCVAYLETV